MGREFGEACLANGRTVWIKTNGTVVVAGNSLIPEGVSEWKDIIAVSAGGSHAVGLKADGTVLATGKNDYGQCKVSKWKNIVAISAGFQNTVGLKADGTVVIAGYGTNGGSVSGWTDIVYIKAYGSNVIGVKADGTIMAVGDTSIFDSISKWEKIDGNEISMEEVPLNGSVWDWDNIIEIDSSNAGESQILGLKADGTVVSVGWDTYGQCEVSSWKDIVGISAGRMVSMGVKADGTVVSTAPGREDWKYNVSTWTDMAVVLTKGTKTIGLKKNGTVLFTGVIEDWERGSLSEWEELAEWSDIMLPTN